MDDEPLTFQPFEQLADSVLAKMARKLEFLREVEKLKTIFRRNTILGTHRLENDAEHSWHIALMAVLFYEDAANRNVDLLRVLKMLLIHDLVEIDAGDVYAFDVAGHRGKAEREAKAADRIFALLPENEGQHLRELWEEFDRGETPDAQFALAMDRVQPPIQNYLYRGAVWHENGISPNQVRGRLVELHEAVPDFGRLVDTVVDDAVQRGFFPEKEGTVATKCDTPS